MGDFVTTLFRWLDAFHLGCPAYREDVGQGVRHGCWSRALSEVSDHCRSARRTLLPPLTK